jgi:hypothetical protein
MCLDLEVACQAVVLQPLTFLASETQQDIGLPGPHSWALQEIGASPLGRSPRVATVTQRVEDLQLQDKGSLENDFL